MLSGKKVIKLTTPWKHSFFYSQTPGGVGVYGDYKFEIDNDCNECDYWIVWGGLNQGFESATVKCPKDNVIFLTDEVHTDRKFFQKFLDQFPTVLTCRTDIEHRNIVYSHELNTWHLKKSYDALVGTTFVPKTKEICVIASNLTLLEGHKARFAFINRLIGHFKDKLDVYGRGLKPFDDKFETLSPYKYSITIENSFVPGYFTEKIAECYLTHTIPIYQGCPNITDFFDNRSMIKIDLNDYKGSIETIEKVLDEDIYEDRIDLLIREKQRYLNEYNVFPGLVRFVDTQLKPINKRDKVTIKREPSFMRFYTLKKLVQIYNNRSFIPEILKFEINFRDEGKYSGK